MTLNYDNFPHIIERIVDFADNEDLPTWRLVSTAMFDYVSSIWRTSAVISLEIGEFYHLRSAKGRVWRTGWEPHVRILDVRPESFGGCGVRLRNRDFFSTWAAADVQVFRCHFRTRSAIGTHAVAWDPSLFVNIIYVHPLCEREILKSPSSERYNPGWIKFPESPIFVFRCLPTHNYHDTYHDIESYHMSTTVLLLPFSASKPLQVSAKDVPSLPMIKFLISLLLTLTTEDSTDYTIVGMETWNGYLKPVDRHWDWPRLLSKALLDALDEETRPPSWEHLRQDRFRLPPLEVISKIKFLTLPE